MKLNPWLLPGVTAAALTVWISIQWREASHLENDIRLIGERIRQGESRHNNELPESDRSSHQDLTLKSLSKFFLDSSRGMNADLRMARRFDRAIMDASLQELMVMVSELEAMSLELQVESEIKQLLFRGMAEKNPEDFLRKYGAGEITSYALAEVVAQAFRQWMKSDPQNAAAWLDQSSSAVGFHRDQFKSPDVKTQLECIAIAGMFQLGEAEAQSRLNGLSDRARSEALSAEVYRNLTPEQDAIYLALLEKNLSKEQIEVNLVNLTDFLISQGRGRVDLLLAHTQNNEAETNSIVTTAVRSQFRKSQYSGTLQMADLLESRSWAVAHGSDVADSAIGKAFAEVITAENSPALIGMLLGYHQNVGSEEVLLSFLKKAKVSEVGIEELGRVISQISGPEKRRELIHEIK